MKTLLRGYITLRLGNVIYAGLPLSSINQVQTILNCTAWAIGGLPKYCHI